MRPADLSTVLRDYLAGWNAPDADRRHDHLAVSVTRDVVYLDPHIPEPVEGLPALESHIAVFRAKYAHRLEAALPPTTFHGVARTRWRLKETEGETMSHGTLVAEVGKDGRLTRIIHFIDAS